MCSRYGHMCKRNDKKFERSDGHVDHADVNGSFNIDKPISYCVIGRDQFDVERLDTLKGSTDTPKAVTLRNKRP